MDVVDHWTGRHAAALQAALRLTHDEMSAFLGVARRTVAGWHEKPETVLRQEFQRALDTAYEGASDHARVRFARQLRADDEAHHPTPAGQPLTVAIAVVVDSERVLLVCRQDSEQSGISWQFPAGIVKPGNSARTIAVRETLAETAVHCSVRRHLGARLHPITGVNCEYYLCDYLAGDATNCDPAENVDVVWAAAIELHRFIPADRVFRSVLEALGGAQ